MQNKKFFLKKGFTLVETIVAIALFTVGTQATVLLFAKIMRSKAYSMEMGKSAFVVSRSMGDLTQYLRRTRQSDVGLYPIVTADDNDLVFYSDYDKNGKTERLHIYFADGGDADANADTIYMGVREPSGTFPVTYASGDGETITLAEHIVNTPSDPVFSYYNKDYPGDLAHNPVATPAVVSEIRLVKIFLKINIDPNNAPDNIQQETFVELRNLNDYDRIY